MRNSKLELTTTFDRNGRTRIGFNIMTYDRKGNGGGVMFSLSAKDAVKLADKLNALLDDPAGDDSNASMRRRKS